MNTPKEIAENYIGIGKAKGDLPIYRMLLLGILAGAFIAVAGVGSVFGNAYAGKVMGAAIFPAGLAMVVIAGSELFTGNCLLILPVTTGDLKISRMLKNWLFVYIGNMIGAMAIAALTVISGTFGNEAVAAALTGSALAKVSLSFGSAFVKGILCNFLVCIAVWMTFAAKTVTGKIVGLFFPIFVFVICGFEHSVANMFYIPAGIFMGTEGVTWFGFFITNLVPVTLGNIVGGCFIGLIYRVLFMNRKTD